MAAVPDFYGRCLLLIGICADNLLFGTHLLLYDQ
jgi:hypothetical protein